MQLSSGRKAIYITVSILLSFVIWFYINNNANVDVMIEDVPVEFLNAESALANKGLVLVSGNDATVDLELNMPRSLVYDFDTEGVRAVANLSSVNSTGTQVLTYSISYPPNVDRLQISVKSPQVQTVSVRVGELFRREDVEIRYKLVGNVAEGYVAGGVQLLPGTLELWGEQSDVMQVSYAQVTLNIENARSTIVELIEYELYDYNDNLIENGAIHAASDTVQVTMPVISATDIPLVVHFIEAPGVRIDSFDYELDKSSIKLSGDANQIAQLGEIMLGEVVLEELGDEEASIPFEIPVPEGLTNLSGVSTATLRIRNRDIVTRNLTVSQFDYENFDVEDRTVEIVTSSLAVTLRGARNDLEDVTPDMVTAVANLSGVTDASGIYTVPAEIRVDGGLDIGTVQNHQVTVRIGISEAGTEASPEEPEQETEQG